MTTPRIAEQGLVGSSPRSGAPTSRVVRTLGSPGAIFLVFPAIVLLVGVFLTVSGQRALRQSNLEMARDRMTDQVALVTAHLSQALDQAEPMLDELGRRVLAAEPTDPAPPLADALRRLLHGRPGVSYVSVSFTDGTFRAAFLEPDGRVTFQESRVQSGSTTDRLFDYGAEGGLTQRELRITDYDPRTRGFYLAATQAKKRVWTAPYAFFGTNVTGVSRAEPLFRRDALGHEALHAVLTIDFDVAALSSVLKKTELPEVETLLYSDGGAVLAYPQGAEALARLAKKNGKVSHYRALGSPLLDRLFAERALRPRSSAPFSMTVGGSPYLVAERRVQPQSLGWNVAYLVPERVFLGGLDAYVRRSAVAAGLALLVAVAVSLFFARLITHARRETAEARAAARRATAEARELGSYRLVQCLGRGGMGEVWRAEHRLLARQAAIKLILKDLEAADEAEVRERFRREAQTLAQLRCRNTIELFDYGVAEDGTFFYVMELLDGLDLENLVYRYGPQSPGRVIQILIQACRSLAEAHDAGLVHRDVKPANIFLSRVPGELDVVKVLDFGLVRMLGEEGFSAEASASFGEVAPGDENHATSNKLTHAGHITGTPEFIAPEQALGQELDGRADLYALGCVGYWLLTGKTLYARNSAMALLLAHIHDPPPNVSASAPSPLPSGLSELIASCLSKSADDRPQSAHILLALLRAIPLEPSQSWSEQNAADFWNAYEAAPRSQGQDRTLEISASSRELLVARAAS